MFGVSEEAGIILTNLALVAATAVAVAVTVWAAFRDGHKHEESIVTGVERHDETLAHEATLSQDQLLEGLALLVEKAIHDHEHAQENTSTVTS